MNENNCDQGFTSKKMAKIIHYGGVIGFHFVSCLKLLVIGEKRSLTIICSCHSHLGIEKGNIGKTSQPK